MPQVLEHAAAMVASEPPAATDEELQNAARNPSLVSDIASRSSDVVRVSRPAGAEAVQESAVEADAYSRKQDVGAESRRGQRGSDARCESVPPAGVEPSPDDDEREQRIEGERLLVSVGHALS